MLNRRAILLLAILGLGGCASGETIVLREASPGFRARAATLEFMPSPEDQELPVTTLQGRMNEAFFDGPRPAFTRGPGLTVRYRLALFQRGSQQQRMIGGTSGGSGQVVVIAEFLGPNGAQLSTANFSAIVSGAGLSIRAATQKVVNDILRFAIARYRG